jgi:hypothetical protein
MPDFTFTSPQGQSYTITGPEGATPEQAFGILQHGLASGAIKPNAAPAAAAESAKDEPSLVQDAWTGIKQGGQKLYGAATHMLAQLDPFMSDEEAQKTYDQGTQTLREANAPQNTPQRWSGKLTGGAVEGLAGPGGVLAGEQSAKSQQIQDANPTMPYSEATAIAAPQAAIQAAASKIPIPGLNLSGGAANLLGSAAKAAGASALVGGATTAASQEATSLGLQAAGLPDQAAQEAPTWGSTLEGAAFQAGAHVGIHAAHAAIPALANGGARAPAPAAPTPSIEGVPIETQLDQAMGRTPTVGSNLQKAVAEGAARAEQQKTDAIAALDSAKDVDGAIGAAFDLASRPQDDIPARVAATQHDAAVQRMNELQSQFQAMDAQQTSSEASPFNAVAHQQAVDRLNQLQADLNDPAVTAPRGDQAALDASQAQFAPPTAQAQLLSDQEKFAQQNARSAAFQRAMQNIDQGRDAAYDQAEQARLQKLQEAVDLHAQLVDHANQATTSDQRQARTATMAADLPDAFGNRTDATPVDTRSAAEIAATTNDPVLKQLFMNRIREDAGMTPGATEVPSQPLARPDLTGPQRQLIEPQGPLKNQSPAYPDAERAPAEAQPAPRYADLTPQTKSQASQRSQVLNAMTAKDGQPLFPHGTSVVEHPAEDGAYAVQANEAPAPHPYSPELQGNKAEAPPSTDPVDLYVNAQRNTNTPAARAFVQEYDAGRITREDVQRAMVEQQRTAPSVDQNVTSAGNVLTRAGRDSVPFNKPRGEGDDRQAAIADSWNAKGEPVAPPGADDGPTSMANGPTFVDRTPNRGYEQDTSLDQAVRRAANGGSPLEKAIAQVVAPFTQGVPFKVVTPKTIRQAPPQMAGARGLMRWSPDFSKHEVWVKSADYAQGSQGSNNGTVLHEALHVATVKKFQRGLMAPENTPVGRAARDLVQLFNHVRSTYEAERAAGKRSPVDAVAGPAFERPEELITWGFVDPRVQDYLKQTPGVINRTAWGDFVARVRGLFNLDKGHTSALADLIDVSHRLMANELPEGLAEAKGRGRAVDGMLALGENPANGTDPRRLLAPADAQAPAGVGGAHPGDAERPGVAGARVQAEDGRTRADGADAPAAARGGRDAGLAGAADARNGGSAAASDRSRPGGGAGVAGRPDLGQGRSLSEAEGPAPQPDPRATQRPLSPQARAGEQHPAPRAVSALARVGAKAFQSLRNFGNTLRITDAINELRDRTMPMSASTGSDRARAWAKDTANQMRVAQYQYQQLDHVLLRNFSKERREAMWNAADEENLIRGGHLERTGANGLDALSPPERAAVERLHQYGEELLARGQAVGMFPDGGLPYWTPRMAVMIGEDGSYSAPPKADVNLAHDLTTSASAAKGRKYLTVEETEAAQQRLLNSDTATAHTLRDIRTMPLAMGRLEQAIAGRELVERIRQASDASGTGLVKDEPEAANAAGYFTLDHPAFKTYAPQMVNDPRTGAKVPATDQFHRPVFQQRPLYIAKEFEGPLKSIIYDPPGKAYGALMALKQEATANIMYSPLIHNQVVFGKALASMPLGTLPAYFEGRALRTGERGGVLGYAKAAGNLVQRGVQAMQGVPYNERARLESSGASPVVRRAIENGMVPINNYGHKQDITSIANDTALRPGQGWKAKLVGKVAGDRGAELADGVGDLVHNHLLWKRVADLQLGVYAQAERHYSEAFQKQGFDKTTADGMAGKVAANLANRVAGTLPNEAMSGFARKFANIALFSRSFTLSNFAMYKDMIRGLPAEVQSQLRLAYGDQAARSANMAMRRKAVGALVRDIGMMYMLNAAFQTGVRAYTQDGDFKDNLKAELAKYGPRATAALQYADSHLQDVLPFVGHPFKWIHSFTPGGTNDPGKENRFRGPDMSDGTATYYRLPFGKVGEDLEGWMSDPGAMAWQKSGTLVKPAIDIGMQAAGHAPESGPIWAPSDSFLSAAGKAVAHYAAGQFPVHDFQVAYDLATAKPDAAASPKEQERTAQERHALELSMLAGITASKGAPGGPEAGQLRAENERFQQQRSYVLSQTHQLLASGRDEDRDQAIDMLRTVMDANEIRSYLKGQESPESRVNAHALTTLGRRDADALERVQAAGQ